MLTPWLTSHNLDNHSMHKAVRCRPTPYCCQGCLKHPTSLHGPQLLRLTYNAPVHETGHPPHLMLRLETPDVFSQTLLLVLHENMAWTTLLT